METPPQFYKIRDLVLLPELNPRAQLCEETIARYMESFDALPPVSIQEGTGVLVDGFHRVEAATRLGAEAIPVRMLDIPDEELHLYAGLGNCGHGRALNRPERNRFMVRLVEQYRWPIEKVARAVGVSPSTVSLAMREHQYNQALSERLGEEVQVINSSHVQALYRVGAEQRAQLLDAVAGKVDDEGRPRPLTGAELKSLVERLEDPQTPAEDLKRLLADPLVRPELSPRRAARAAALPDAAPGGPSPAVMPAPADRCGPAPSPPGSQREQLLERALAPDTAEHSPARQAWDQESAPGAGSEIRLDLLQDERLPRGAERFEQEWRPAEAAAPLGLDREPEIGTDDPPTLLALLDPVLDSRTVTGVLGEAERLLCDLCSRIEDAELWDQIRAARDLVREAARLVER